MESRSPLKSKPLPYAGKSLDDQIIRVIEEHLYPAYWGAAIFWFLAGWEWWAGYKHLPRSPWLWTIVAVLATAVFGAVFFRTRRTIQSLRLGRDGERIVGQLLDGLRENGARIFHDITGDGFNLDHVVISSRGVLVVETKTLSKRSGNDKITTTGTELLVAGHRMSRDPLAQVQAQMDWLRRLLGDSAGKRLPVRGAVVFPNWWVDPKANSIHPDIWVLEPKALGTFLQNAPARMRPEDVALAAFHLSQYVLSKQ